MRFKLLSSGWKKIEKLRWIHIFLLIVSETERDRKTAITHKKNIHVTAQRLNNTIMRKSYPNKIKIELGNWRKRVPMF